MITFAYDFETRYDDELSVKTLGARAYFGKLSLEDIYLVTVCGDNGFEYAGHPKDLDWSFLAGQRALNHNAGFDQEGVLRLRELGVQIPEPAELHDTADLAAYCGIPRSLKGAAFALFKVQVDKNIRDKDMKGKGWSDMSPDLREAVSKYALEDARLTLKIWQTLADRWPDAERLVSRLSREWASEGIAADVPMMEAAIASLKQTIWEASRKIPWVIDGDAAPLSPKALGLACREAGIPAPKSLAMDSEDCDQWLDQYGEQYPWVLAMRDWRRANAILKKLEAMMVRTIGGRLRYEIKYWGAGTTGRWSGAGGVNIQNLSGKELYGVNMRDMLIPAPGHVLIAADLAQIEPRVASYLAGEKEALAQMASGVSPYIVYARQAMGLGPDEVWPKNDARYKLAKVSVLGAAYCAGHHRFIDVMRAYGMDDLLNEGPQLEDTPERYRNYVEAVAKKEWMEALKNADELEKKRLMRSWEIIQTFRLGRPKLVSLWKKLGELAKKSAERGEDMELTLPSGRTLVYKKCRFRRLTVKEGGGHDVVADIVRHGMPQTTRVHQGILVENLCQATARDAFRDCLLAVQAAGLKVIFHVHDELIVEVPEDQAEQAKQQILSIMARSPHWAPALPVEAEATVADRYSKAK
jgi:DNA polymerase I-like protein with 3'-5' exonuclease and polymerase domains